MARAVADAATFVGFDSAWADNPKARGAICAVSLGAGGFVGWRPPELVGFEAAASFVRDLRRTDRPTLIAIDQPTIVPNETRSRPVDRAVGSVIGWVGGGVQPANTGKTAMFGADAPIWRFKAACGVDDDPERARRASGGTFLMEVFPALALLSLDEQFFARKKGPRYNPARKTFRLADWQGVVAAASAEAERLGCGPAADWLRGVTVTAKPAKARQDELDAVLCLLVALRWRRDPRDMSAVVGDLTTGYVLAPVTGPVRKKLADGAAKAGLPAPT